MIFHSKAVSIHYWIGNTDYYDVLLNYYFGRYINYITQTLYTLTSDGEMMEYDSLYAAYNNELAVKDNNYYSVSVTNKQLSIELLIVKAALTTTAT